MARWWRVPVLCTSLCARVCCDFPSDLSARETRRAGRQDAARRGLSPSHRSALPTSTSNHARQHRRASVRDAPRLEPLPPVGLEFLDRFPPRVGVEGQQLLNPRRALAVVVTSGSFPVSTSTQHPASHVRQARRVPDRNFPARVRINRGAKLTVPSVETGLTSGGVTSDTVSMVLVSMDHAHRDGECRRAGPSSSRTGRLALAARPGTAGVLPVRRHE